MLKNATVKAGNAVRSTTPVRQGRQLTSIDVRSNPEPPWSKGAIKGMLTKTKASFLIEHRTVSISVEIPVDLHAELLEAFAEKLKSDFIKNLYHVATLPSNFRTPFLKKMKEKEVACYSNRGQRTGSVSQFFFGDEFFHVQTAWPEKKVVERSNTKEAQLSIGLTSSAKIYELVELIANKRTESTSKIACELFSHGLDTLSAMLHDEDDEIVFCNFENRLNELKGSSTRRWMLRIDRKRYNRVSLLGQEFGKSLANLALLCLVYSLAEKKEEYFNEDHHEILHIF